jgi:hypothetical protein
VDDAERLAVVIGEVVCIVERVADLVDHVERDLDRHDRAVLRAVPEDLAQVPALDQLHGDEVGLADLSELVGLGDVGVTEERGEPSLAHERAHHLGVLREVGEHALQRDDLAEAFDAGLLGAVDLCHAADSELFVHGVRTERLGHHPDDNRIGYRQAGIAAPRASATSRS